MLANLRDLKDSIKITPNLYSNLGKISIGQDLQYQLSEFYLKSNLKVNFEEDIVSVLSGKNDNNRFFPYLYFKIALDIYDLSAEVSKYYSVIKSIKESEFEVKPFIKENYKKGLPSFNEVESPTNFLESTVKLLEGDGENFVKTVKSILDEDELSTARFLSILFNSNYRFKAKNPLDEEGFRSDFQVALLSKLVPLNFNKHGENLPLLCQNLIEAGISKEFLEKEIIFTPRTNSELPLAIQTSEKKIQFPHNRIIYGAPGTGKSFQLKQDLSGVPEDRIIRVTFNPEISYGQFVGAYKPVNNVAESRIIYDLVPGPLLNALVKAQSGDPVFLIIEEINRANVSAVFGDFFQTLDRDESGKSTYGIACSPEITSYLTANGVVLENGDHVILPANLYLWATMNSADQGVFTLDTAFKRRWSFEYVPLNKGSVHINRSNITLSEGVSIKWDFFRNELNGVLKTMKVPEDKLIGPFFLTQKEMNAKSGFLGKLSLYLWDDVLRHKNRSAIFKSETLSELTEISHNHTGDLNSLLDKLFEDSLAERLKENIESEEDTQTNEVAGEEENQREI